MTAHPDTLHLRVGPRVFRLRRDCGKVGITYAPGLRRPQRFSVEAGVLGAVPRMRYEVPGCPITIVDLEETPAGARWGPLGAGAQMADAPEVGATFPVFMLGDKRVVLTAEISVGFDPSITDARTLAAGSGLRILAEGPDFAIFALPESTGVPEWTERLGGSPGVRYAEPNLVTIGSRVRAPTSVIAFTTGGPEGVQRAFANVRAPEARAQVTPGPELRVAILDDGIDLGHSALAPSLAASFDAISGAEAIPANVWDFHGTACAGIVAGRLDAPPYTGIAAGAALLGVRIAQSPAPGQPWATSNSIIRRGIDWAVDQGADILSNSWGGPPSTIVADGVRRGLDQGRGGKGAVFVVAAGNSGGPVEFPATLSGVIAVSGVNLDDEPKTFSSSDGETWWASNVGPEIDIAAPSVRIRTTDTGGAPGRTPTDWRDDFNGTSAACPIVAGAAALVLAAAPGLTAGEVAECLAEGAAQVPTVVWTGTGMDDRLGHGRLDIAAALQRAGRSRAMTGPLQALALGPGVTLYRISDPEAPALFLPHADDSDALAAAAAGGAAISVSFDSREETPIGLLLRGARLVSDTPAPAPAPDGYPDDEPAPTEVRLPRPEDDVFRSFGALVPDGEGPAENDLTRIKGIGAARAEALARFGISTIGDLARLSEADAEGLDRALGALADVARREDWIGQAESLAAGAGDGPATETSPETSQTP